MKINVAVLVFKIAIFSNLGLEVLGQINATATNCQQKGPGAYPFVDDKQKAALCTPDTIVPPRTVDNCQFYYCVPNVRLNTWFIYAQACIRPANAATADEYLFNPIARKCQLCVKGVAPWKDCKEDEQWGPS